MINNILPEVHCILTHEKSTKQASLLLSQISIPEFQADIALPVDESKTLSYFCNYMSFNLKENVLRFMFEFWLTHGYLVHDNVLIFLEGLSHRSMNGGQSFNVLLFGFLIKDATLDWTPEYCNRVFYNLVSNVSYFDHSMVYDLFSDKIQLGPEILTRLMLSGVSYGFVKRLMKLGFDFFHPFKRHTAISLAITDHLYEYNRLLKWCMTKESYPHYEKVRIYMKYLEDATGKTFRDFPLNRNLFERHRDGALQAANAFATLSEFSQYSTGDTWFSLVPSTEILPVGFFDSAELLNEATVALNGTGDSYVNWLPIDILSVQFGELYKSIYCTVPSSEGSVPEPPRARRRLF